uniref:G-patch domain-containing protein n=1 Tax=Tetradesmus obliquus TaxID=3088 RepID=A0A383VX19_TETOB|eukprot:jgi/Sobl393_1/15506/SZX69362.1
MAPVVDEEQHLESFNMDNDYEGLVEVDGEFLYREKRKKRQQTREEQLYGYQSSDEEDEGYNKRGSKRSKADYTKPVGFVSSGVFVQQPPEEQQQQPQPQQRPGSAGENGSSGAGLGFGGAGLGFSSGGATGGGLGFSAPAGEGTAGLGSARAGLGAGSGSAAGLGFTAGGSSGGGLGFKAAGAADAGMARHQQQQQDDDDGADEEAVLPTAFGRRIKAAAQQKMQRKQAEQARASDRIAAKQADPRFAAFEAHTKGIGQKLLEKMGFQPGKGLGKSKQGIAAPIEAKLRPKGMGMGFGDYKEAKMVVPGKAGAGLGAAAAAGGAADAAAAAELEQELAAATAKTQPPLWKKKAAPAREKRTYKTAAEVLEEAGGAPGARPPAAQPILDLRGPQARLVTDLEQLNAGAGDGSAPDTGTAEPMPELAHNMGLLVSLTEAQLRRLDAALQNQQDTAALLAQEQSRLQQEVAAAAAAARRMQGLAAQLQAVQDGGSRLSLEQLHVQYAAMAAGYPEEYVLYSLPAAALAQVLPLLRALLAGWQPLLQPALGAEQFKAWRGLLEGEGVRQAVLGSWEDSEDPYGVLVGELVMPPIRSAITTWEPRCPEPLLAWLDAWQPLLPRGALRQLLTGLVLPRIAASVESWDPTRETQPIHAWLHPWLPHLAAELAGVYPTIRHRLSRALTAWHASDGSARLLLAPWAGVFEPADWEALLARSILPKLAQSLQTELVLNPLTPQLEPFHWALAWQGLLPTAQLAALLEAAFFPAWHALLHHWLSHTPNFDEVTRWYLEWKGLFPQELLDHPRVRAGFSTALNMMNSAADGQPLPAAAAAASAAGPVPSWRAEINGAGMDQPAAAAKAPRGAGAAAVGEPSFKDLVARYAEEQGLDFVPRAGRLHDGLQVYSFGGVSCVVDAAHSLVRAQLQGRGWAPVSLDKLRQEAAARRGS